MSQMIIYSRQKIFTTGRDRTGLGRGRHHLVKNTRCAGQRPDAQYCCKWVHSRVRLGRGRTSDDDDCVVMF